MAQDGTATVIRPRHRRDPRGDGLRSGRHRQVSPLIPAVPNEPTLLRHEVLHHEVLRNDVLRDDSADVAVILPWLVVLGFLGLLAMLLTSWG